MRPLFIKIGDVYVNSSAVRSIAFVAEKVTPAVKPANPLDNNPWEHSPERRTPAKYVLTYVSGDTNELSVEEGKNLIERLDIV